MILISVSTSAQERSLMSKETDSQKFWLFHFVVCVIIFQNCILYKRCLTTLPPPLDIAIAFGWKWWGASMPHMSMMYTAYFPYFHQIFKSPSSPFPQNLRIFSLIYVYCFFPTSALSLRPLQWHSEVRKKCDTRGRTRKYLRWRTRTQPQKEVHFKATI